MSTYVLPQVIVFQEFNTVPAVVAHPLRAHISGGHAKLLRFSQPAEKALGFLGYYDNLLATDFPWPDRPAGAVIDADYTKVWLQNPILRYFNTSVGGGDDVTRLAGYNNRIRAANLNFAVHGSYLRSADFLDRDVRPGDVVKVRGLDGDSVVQTLWSSVRALHGDLTAAEVDAAVADVNNATSQSPSAAVVKVSGILNGVIATVDASAYEGTVSGFINETYDFIVTAPGVDSDDTQARLRVISGSGTDDQTSVTPAVRGVPFAVGTRGLTVTFADDDLSSSSTSAEDAGVPVDELILGHRWRVTVHQSFTPVTATSGGVYNGSDDTIYVVTVSRGGLYAGTTKPQISVSTTNGVDISGPTSVTAAATDVAVGTQGTTVQFNGTKLRKGDRYYVTVTASAPGPYKIIELSNNLNGGITAGTELDLELYILRPSLQVAQDRLGFAPLLNWTQTDTTLTVNSGVVAYDPSYTDDGVPVALDVFSESSQHYGQLYAEYRAWLPGLCTAVNGVSDVGALDDAISGALTPDNPLKWGVFKALENANGVEVKFTSVCDPADDASWADTLSLLLGRDDVYGLVPLTRRQTVLDLFHAHVNAESAAAQALWRVAWFNLSGVPEVPVVSAGSTVVNHLAATTSDGEVCLCVVDDDPQADGPQYTILRCTSLNGDFVSNGVRPGDIVRTQYTGDGFGGATYGEYVVDAVTAEDQLRLLTGPAAPVSVGAKTEVWRNLTPSEEAAAIVQTAGSYDDRRVKAVWPDQVEAAGTVMDGFFLCASLAGLSSGVLPQQGLTRLGVAGYTSVPRTNVKFNRTQLDAMAGGGVWIVTQDPVSGAIYNRHAVTTAPYDDIDQREEMITRNVDSISYRFKEHFAPFIGVVNVTPIVVTRIGTEVINLVNLLRTEAATPNLGGQLVDAAIVDLAADPVLKDRIVLHLQLTVPFALNNLELHLQI